MIDVDFPCPQQCILEGGADALVTFITPFPQHMVREAGGDGSLVARRWG